MFLRSYSRHRLRAEPRHTRLCAEVRRATPHSCGDPFPRRRTRGFGRSPNWLESAVIVTSAQLRECESLAGTGGRSRRRYQLLRYAEHQYDRRPLVAYRPIGGLRLRIHGRDLASLQCFTAAPENGAVSEHSRARSALSGVSQRPFVGASGSKRVGLRSAPCARAPRSQGAVRSRGAPAVSASMCCFTSSARGCPGIAR